MNTHTRKAYTENAANERQSRRGSRLFSTDRKAGNGNPVETAELLQTLAEARNEWLDAVRSFEHTSEEMLVDYYTYKMKACEARYTYFIKLAKEKGLTFVAGSISGAV